MNNRLKMLAPNLGFTAAAFAAFLTVLNSGNRSAFMLAAVSDFSTGIPLIVGCIIFMNIRAVNAYLHQFMYYLSGMFQVIGSFLCLRGIYYCFKDIAPAAAENFKIVSGIFFILSVALVLITDIEGFYRKRKGK
jgi:hypothetical protein